jgi:hypothetical protein
VTGIFGKPRFPDHDTLLAQRNRIIERHPGTTFIGAHLGNYPEDLIYVDGCLDRYPNFCVDTSARIGEIGRHPVEEAHTFSSTKIARSLVPIWCLAGMPLRNRIRKTQQSLGTFATLIGAFSRRTSGRSKAQTGGSHEGGDTIAIQVLW